jgi:hypothetical protein
LDANVDDKRETGSPRPRQGQENSQALFESVLIREKAASTTAAPPFWIEIPPDDPSIRQAQTVYPPPPRTPFGWSLTQLAAVSLAVVGAGIALFLVAGRGLSTPTVEPEPLPPATAETGGPRVEPRSQSPSAAADPAVPPPLYAPLPTERDLVATVPKVPDVAALLRSLPSLPPSSSAGAAPASSLGAVASAPEVSPPPSGAVATAAPEARPTPVVEPSPVVDAVAAPTPALSPETVTPAAPPSAAPPRPAASNNAAGPSTAELAAATDEQVIRGIVERYRAAYSALDAGAVQAVWPKVNTRALTRAFEQLATQQIDFSGCAIALAGERASAHCAGNVEFVPKVGNKTRRVETRTWSFELKKSSAQWAIDAVESR